MIDLASGTGDLCVDLARAGHKVVALVGMPLGKFAVRSGPMMAGGGFFVDKAEFPNDLNVQITKEGNSPAKIVVKQGETVKVAGDYAKGGNQGGTYRYIGAAGSATVTAGAVVTGMSGRVSIKTASGDVTFAMDETYRGPLAPLITRFSAAATCAELRPAWRTRS